MVEVNHYLVGDRVTLNKYIVSPNRPCLPNKKKQELRQVYIIKLYHIIVLRPRTFACVPTVAGTHAPGRDEGVVGSRRWLGDIITAGSSCRGCKGQRQCQVVETLTPHIHAPGGAGGLDSIICKLGWTVLVLFANCDGRDCSQQ